MKAPRVRAGDVQVGDAILCKYRPRTWQRVQGIAYDGEQVMLDTARDRTWYDREYPLPCRRMDN